MKTQDRTYINDSGKHRLRVLTGTIVYRLSSRRNDPRGGRHVWCSSVGPAGELGPRELVSVRVIETCTQHTEPTRGSNDDTE